MRGYHDYFQNLSSKQWSVFWVDEMPSKSRPESGISGLEKTAPPGELEFSSSSN